MSPLTLDAKTVRHPPAAPAGSHRSSPRVPASEYAGPRARFRVIVRRPLPPPYRLRRVAPRNPLKRALALAGVPAMVLITYVALWTGAMHGGYYEQRISDRIKTLQIENDVLQAQLRQLQAPGRILVLAKGMGMRPAEAVQFVDATGARRVAQAAPVAPPPTLGTILPAPAPR